MFGHVAIATKVVLATNHLGLLAEHGHVLVEASMHVTFATRVIAVPANTEGNGGKRLLRLVPGKNR